MESVNGISKNNHQLCLMNIWAMFLPGGGWVRLHYLLHFIKINSSNLQVSMCNKKQIVYFRVWSRCECVRKTCVSVSVCGYLV